MGKPWALAMSTTQRLMREGLKGDTMIVHACGCKSLLTQAACRAAMETSIIGLMNAILDALTKHQRPTDNMAILVPHE